MDLKKYRWDILAIIILLIAAGVPRLVDLGTFLTADEKTWIGRSYEFIRAFKDWRFNDMLQTTHPGVTTMWVVGAAVTAKMFLAHIPFSSQTLAHFVTAAQWPIALLNTLAVPLIYVFLRKLLPGRVPLLAALFIALDPFLIGYSRVAHVDALLTSFLFLACLAMLIYAKQNYERRWLVVAAVLGALAILTKAPGIFALPFLLLVILVWGGRQLTWRQRLRDLVLWLLIVVILAVIIWPAILWVPDPKGNILVLKRDLATATLTPHNMTEDYTLNPWHYPLAILTRTTPVTLVFTGVYIFWLIWLGTKKKSLITGCELRVPWLLLAYIFFFILMMTLGAKKGDRYILPVWPAIDVLAAMGVFVASRKILKIARYSSGSAELAEKFAPQFILNTIVILYLVFVVARYHPYAIAYSDPLFPDNLSQELGWGEGLDQVGAWLNEHAPAAAVASWYPEELQAYTAAHVAHINAHEQTKIRYVVLYHNMFGRAPEHPANDFIDEYYKKREPVFIAHVVGKEFAWVYEKPIYERNVGELVPGKTVRQTLDINHRQLAAVDVFPATYSGKAKTGELLVILRDAAGKQLASWQEPVAELDDNHWLTLWLREPLDINPGQVTVEISAQGTQADDAPTIRQSTSGRLAVRARFRLSPTQSATEEEAKLLPGK